MKDKDLTETRAQGYKVENGKLIYFSNMLDGYKHEYKDLKEICEEMNGLLKRFNSYEEQLSFWKYKAEEKFPEDSIVLSREEYNTLKAENDKYVKDCIDYIATINKLENKVWEVEQQANKETAEKIFKMLISNLDSNQFLYGKRIIMEVDVENLAKQFGVEIME